MDNVAATADFAVTACFCTGDFPGLSIARTDRTEIHERRSRHEVYYLSGAKFAAIRLEDMKFQFMQEPTGWPGAKVTTDMPTVANLRRDSFERLPMLNGETINTEARGYVGRHRLESSSSYQSSSREPRSERCCHPSICKPAQTAANRDSVSFQSVSASNPRSGRTIRTETSRPSLRSS